MLGAIAGHSIVVAAKEQLSCELGGEATILHAKSGVYYALDCVGARVWDLIQQPRRVEEIRKTVVAEYDVEPERCERDVIALLENLLAAGLIEVRSDAAG